MKYLYLLCLLLIGCSDVGAGWVSGEMGTDLGERGIEGGVDTQIPYVDWGVRLDFPMVERGLDMGKSDTKPSIPDQRADRSVVAPPADQRVIQPPDVEIPVDTTEPFVPPPMVLIPAGSDVLGSPLGELGRSFNHLNEELPTTYTFESFWIGKYEVTQKEYQAVMGFLPSYPYQPPVCLECPVTFVNQVDIIAFCNALSARMGMAPYYGELPAIPIVNPKGYRMVLDAEWEYAYRAGTDTATYVGDLTDAYWEPLIDPIAWYRWTYSAACGVTVAGAQPVGKKQPNAWGLYDMAGNASEIAYSNSYRGGYFKNDAWALRAAYRYFSGYRYSWVGFRIARTP